MPQYLNHHLKLHHLHFTEINELYISLSVHAFSSGMIGIFVPIYLYNLGLKLSTIALYFLLFTFTKFIVFPIATHLSLRFGPKHILMLSYLLMFSYTLMLFFLPGRDELLYPTAIVGGIAAGLFWISRHIDFATIISQERPTAQLSLLLILLTLAQALAPLIGGVIATIFGIEFVLLGASIGQLISMYPLSKTLEPVIPQTTRFKLFKTAPIKHMIANFAMNAQSNVAVYIWPLFIYLVVMTYRDVGLISSASLIIVIILLHILGRVGDHGKNMKLLNISSLLRSVVHAVRTLTRTFASAMGVNILGDVTDTLTSVPYAVHFYKNAKRHGVATYLMDLEMVGSIGAAMIWTILLVMSSITDPRTALITTFITAALVTPLLRFIEPLPSKETTQL
jgi:MFS family permease